MPRAWPDGATGIVLAPGDRHRDGDLLAAVEMIATDRGQALVEPGRVGERAQRRGGVRCRHTLRSGDEPTECGGAEPRSSQQAVAGRRQQPRHADGDPQEGHLVDALRRGVEARRARARWRTARGLPSPARARSSRRGSCRRRAARSRPSSSRNSPTSPVSDGTPAGVPGGGNGESAKPGRSSATTSRSAASRSSTGSQTCQRLPIPWIRTSGSPLPARW